LFSGREWLDVSIVTCDPCRSVGSGAPALADGSPRRLARVLTGGRDRATYPVK